MKNNYLEVFGLRVKELRLRTGLSQEKFALKIGIEAGKRNIALINIKKIADGLDIPISVLFESL